MHTVNYRGRGLADGPVSPKDLRKLADEIMGEYSDAIFVAYLDVANRLVGCSVLLGLRRGGAASAASRVAALGFELQASEIVVLIGGAC